MVNRKVKRRRVPPSRVRYEATHPNVTSRVDRETYDQLKTLKETTGQSAAEVLKVGLGKVKAVAGDAYDKGREDGYVKGFEDARTRYQVTFYCARCRRRHLAVTSDEQKEDVANLMYKAGWYDPACSQR